MTWASSTLTCVSQGLGAQERGTVLTSTRLRYLIHFPISLEFVPFDHYYPPEWCGIRLAALAEQRITRGSPRWPGRTDKPGNTGIMRLADVPYQETWRAMEEVHALGMAKHIGVSNLSAQLVMDVLKYAKVKPACNQIENHVYLQQPGLVNFCLSQDIAVVAYSPLGAVSYIGIGLADKEENALTAPAVLDIAKKAQCTPAQVLLKYQLQRGVIVIPKSQNPERLVENLRAADVVLDEADMAALAALDRHRRFNDPGHFARGWGEPGSWVAKYGYPIHG